MVFLQASVLLLCLNGVGTVSEVRGEDCVVAVEVQEMTPRSLGNQRLSELLSGVTQGEPTALWGAMVTQDNHDSYCTSLSC